MRVVIIEDDPAAVKHLKKLLTTVKPHIGVCASFDNVKDTVVWFENHEEPDMMFLDIQLADGLGIEIFERINVKWPVIFTIGYDEYVIFALESSDMDYLLKPVNAKELNAILQQYSSLEQLNDPLYQKKLNTLLKQFNRECG